MCATVTPQSKMCFSNKIKSQIIRYNYILEFKNFRENVEKVQRNTRYGFPSTLTMCGVDGCFKNWNCEFYPRGYKNFQDDKLCFLIWREDDNKNIDNLHIELSILDYEMKKVRSDLKKNKRKKTSTQDSMLLCDWLIFPVQLKVILDPAEKILDPVDNTLKVIIECDVKMKVENQIKRVINFIDTPKNTVQDNLSKFICDDRFSDVVIEVNGVELKAHKVILAAQSPVFSAMFDQEGTTVDSKINRVKIEEFEPAVVRQMLEFIYTGKEPSEIDEYAEELISAAHEYQLEKLSTMSEAFLTRKISLNNAIETFIFAHVNELKILRKAVFEFIQMHRNLLKEEELKNFERNHPQLASEVYQKGDTHQNQVEGLGIKKRKTDDVIQFIIIE